MSQTQVSRPDSLHEQDPHNKKDEKKKSRRPANTAFRQQRLKAWQPILTPKTVLPLFFAVGVIFAPIGGLLLWASSQVQEIVIDYSNCATHAPEGNVSSKTDDGTVTMSFQTTAQTAETTWNRSFTTDVVNGIGIPTTTCSLYFTIPDDLKPPVFLYYRLTNFYQNHRRYVKSLDANQLKGDAVSNNTISSSSCDPLKIDPETKKAYYPCGLIANSWFNDTFSEPYNTNEDTTYSMTNKGIAWPTDKELYNKTKYSPDQVSPPPNWRTRYPEYTTDNPPPDLHDIEEFQVWMRTAGLPTFSKLARRNDTKEMKRGTYRLDIKDYFPVTVYGGTKSIVITTSTVMGGKNPFMGIAYVVVGGICILLGALFTVAHLVRPRKLGDHTYLTWNNEQPSAAVATGRDNRYGPSAAP